MIFKRLAMKKTFKFLLFAIAGFVIIASCTAEQIEPAIEKTPEKKQLVEVHFKAANPGNPATKTSMEATSEGYSLTWDAGDMIGATSLVFEDVENQWGYTDRLATLYPFTTEDGGATASFSGKLQAGESYHFFYPAQFRYQRMWEGGEIAYSLPPRTKILTRSYDGEEEEEETPEFTDSQVMLEYSLLEQNANGEWDCYEAPEGGIPVATTSVPDIQYPQAGSFDSYADIMVATNTIDVPSPEPGVTTVEISTSPTFERLVSFLRTSIKDATNGWFDGQHIKEIYLQTDNYSDYLVAPTAYIDLLNNTLAIESSETHNLVKAIYDENTWYTPAVDGSQSTYFAVLPGQISQYTSWGSNYLTFGGETEDVRFKKVVELREPIILEQGKVTKLSFTITQDHASRRPAVNAIVVEGFGDDEAVSFDIGGQPKTIGFTPTWDDDGKNMWLPQEIVNPELITITSSNPQIAVAEIVTYFDYDDTEQYSTDTKDGTPYLTYYLSLCPEAKGTATITIAYGNLSTTFDVDVDDPEFITFADPQVAQVAPTLEGWDYNGDGHISLNEAKDVTSIPYNAFSGNTDLVSFDDLATYFPNLQYIYENAFNGCTRLASITFPEGLNSIYSQAFNGCTSLEVLNLPSSCNWLGENAFKDCSSLTEIHLSASQRVSFGASVFAGCANVTNVTGMSASEDGRCIFYEEGKLYFFFPAGLESYKFPASVKSILYGSDSNNYSVQYTYALQLLYDNTTLKELDFSDTGITKYTSGTGSMIASSKVERVILPRKMTSFEDSCFYGSYLKDVVFTAPEAPAYAYYPFSESGNIVNFYVPFQSYDLYMAKYSSRSNFTDKAKPDVTDVVCTDFSITAGDVHGRESTTKINWTYTYNGTLYNGEPVTGQTLTGTAISEDFGQNTASSPRTVTVSYTKLGETASCSITQGAWDTEWVSALPDGTQWRVATSIQNVEGVPFAYNLYESDSNYSAQDGNANIRIVVEGYHNKTIRFYVISSGHNSYSYLWVMKPNMEPLAYMFNQSTDSNSILARTYWMFGERDGIGPSGTEFSHYREVIVNDVSDGDVIWVQYGKSETWWNTPWNGRGFLLMPVVQD